MRHELAEEKSRITSLLQEMEELRLSASVEQNRRYQADHRARRAEEERKLMGDQLTKHWKTGLLPRRKH